MPSSGCSKEGQSLKMKSEDGVDEERIEKPEPGFPRIQGTPLAPADSKEMVSSIVRAEKSNARQFSSRPEQLADLFNVSSYRALDSPRLAAWRTACILNGD